MARSQHGWGPADAGWAGAPAPAESAGNTLEFPFTHAEHPNDLWCIDLKGWFRTGDGVRIDPLTVEDADSRYLLACQGLRQPRGPAVRRVLEGAFREYGLPKVIRSDNGPPFASVGLGELSSLAV